MKSLVLFVCAIEMIIVTSRDNFKRNNNSKYWNIFIGSVFGSFISLVLAYISNTILDLGEALVFMFVCALVAIINVVLLLVGLAQKNKLQVDEVELNESSIFIGVLVVFFSVMVFIINPVIKEQKDFEIISNYTITNLNHKYGDNSFEIVNVEKHYSYDGIVSAYHTGYEVTASSPVLNNDFLIRITGTDPQMVNIETDEFINKYYEEKTNEYLASKYDIDFDLKVERKNIPYNLGHIPTFDELVDYDAIDDLYIWVKGINYYTEDAKVDYLEKFSSDLINCLNISKDVSIDIRVPSTGKINSFVIKITNGAVEIISK